MFAQFNQPVFTIARWVFARALGAVFLLRFHFARGADSLSRRGTRHIIPAQRFLDAVWNHLGVKALWQVPTLCWINASDPMLVALCFAGAALSIIMICGSLSRLVRPAPLGALPFSLLDRDAVHQFSMGRLAAGNRAGRHAAAPLAKASAMGTLALSRPTSRALVALVAALSAHGGIRRGKARQQRPDVACAHRPRCTIIRKRNRCPFGLPGTPTKSLAPSCS